MDRPPDPAHWVALVRRQRGAVSRAQVFAQGISKGGLAAHLAAGRWQRPIPGIFVTFSGPMPLLTRFWVALLHAGPGAVLSHTTAGVLWGILPPYKASSQIHVTIPITRGTRSRRGMVVHRSSTPPVGIGSPPRTSVAVTAVALCSQARRKSDITAILGRVAQQHPYALADVVRHAVKQRNLRWRAEILAAGADVGAGAHSPLERAYLVDVERAHGLPTGERQRPVDDTCEDVHYKKQNTTVELDGRAVHDDPETRRRDRLRDNASGSRNQITLRYRWDDVRDRPCEVAAEVAAALRARGWRGRPKSCRRGCRPA